MDESNSKSPELVNFRKGWKQRLIHSEDGKVYSVDVTFKPLASVAGLQHSSLAMLLALLLSMLLYVAFLLSLWNQDWKLAILFWVLQTFWATKYPSMLGIPKPHVDYNKE